METRIVKNLIIQTYYTDTIERGTKNTYKPFPKLERLSRKCFELYAKNVGADYEFCETPETSRQASAHWLRMVMFNRHDYDNVLYVDCDVLINRARLKDNIFGYDGMAVNKIWAFPFCNQVDTDIEFPNHPSGDFNAGVVKWSKAECEIMKDKIDNYYHPTHNQSALNLCYAENVGKWKKLPYKFNVTHRPTSDITFRHYAGLHKEKQNLKRDPVWKQWAK